MIRRFRILAAVPLLVGAVLLPLLGFAPAQPSASAQPPAALPALPSELQYVPSDAAVLVHFSATQLWDRLAGKTLRSEPQTAEAVTAQVKEWLGVGPEAVQGVALFWPKIKQQEHLSRYGLVISLRQPLDKDKFREGMKKMISQLGSLQPVFAHAPNDRLIVLLVGLDKEYAKPRVAGPNDPLTSALREAASGKHLVVAAANLAGLPDELENLDLPPGLKPLQPLLRADTVTALVDADQELAVEVRVKSATATLAKDASKAFEALMGLAENGYTQWVAGAGKEFPDATPGDKAILAILRAVGAGLKNAKVTTDGKESRARVAIPADLPFDTAFREAVVRTRRAAARMKSQNNLKQLVLAVHSYHDANGRLPADITDKNGKPLLSWRVHMLPYIEQQKLYQQFKLDEPWDSPANKKASQTVVKLFLSPNSSVTTDKDGYALTNYMGSAGPGAAFEPGKKLTIPDFADGTSNTILLLENENAISWAKPGDFTYDPKKPLPKITAPGMKDAFHVAMGDGSVRLVNTKVVSEKTLKAMFTRAGGEVLGPDAP